MSHFILLFIQQNYSFFSRVFFAENLSFIKYTVLSKPHLAYAQKRKDNHKKTQCCFLLERNLLFLQHKRRLKEISCSVDADVKSEIYIRFDFYYLFILPLTAVHLTGGHEGRGPCSKHILLVIHYCVMTPPAETLLSGSVSHTVLDLQPQMSSCVIQ